MKMKSTYTTAAAAFLLTTVQLNADHVILDDCIIDGSMCVGLDCVNGENFGFDTIRMKENNLRFHFDDTSIAAAFPRNDWRLIANDSANGGDSYLGIEDVTGGRIPFRVEAGAGNHSLFVESTGDVGFGTNNPVVKVHVVDGDTPTVRLEQDGSSGWNPQTWDMAGNETNFFIRDVTHGSKLPFRIRPDAPTNSIEIEADGNIDIPKTITLGTTAAEIRLDIPDAGNDTDYPAIRLGEAFISSGTGDARFSNNTWYNGSVFAPNNKDRVGAMLRLTNNEFDFFATSAGLVGEPLFTRTAELLGNGDFNILGAMGSLSDKNQKRDIEQVDTGSVLERLAEVPISTWRYKHGGEGAALHLGPMAQDFRAAFGLGSDEKILGLGDSAGVALASAQELYKQVQEKEERISDLEKRNDELEARLERIEKALLQSAAK